MDARNFYSNKGWVNNGARDVWCKDCVAKLTTRDDLQRYFWENHREWSAPAWDAATRKARETLSMNKTYQAANAERKLALEERFAVREMLGIMNKVAYYKYYDPGEETYEAAIASGRFDVEETPSEPRSKTKVYSSTFNGSFTEADLAYLTKFYNDMGGDDIGFQFLGEVHDQLGTADQFRIQFRIGKAAAQIAAQGGNHQAVILHHIQEIFAFLAHQVFGGHFAPGGVHLNALRA